MSVFVCVEVDTEDILKWTEFDKDMANELAATHRVWGSLNNKAIVCKLPSNLFSIPLTVTTNDIRKDIRRKTEELIRKHWSSAYTVFVLISESWTQEDKNAEAPNSSRMEISSGVDISRQE